MMSDRTDEFHELCQKLMKPKLEMFTIISVISWHLSYINQGNWNFQSDHKHRRSWHEPPPPFFLTFNKISLFPVIIKVCMKTTTNVFT